MSHEKPIARFEINAQASELKRVRAFVYKVASCCPFSAAVIDQIILAVNEACANIILHAYGHEESGLIQIDFLKDTAELTILIRDYAKASDKSKIRSRPLDDLRPGGLGVYLIFESMDEVEYQQPSDGEGNLLRMRKKFS